MILLRESWQEGTRLNYLPTVERKDKLMPRPIFLVLGAIAVILIAIYFLVLV